MQKRGIVIFTITPN